MTDEPSADPVAERRAVGREMSRKVGFPVWQVRVEVRSHRDVVALAGYLPPRDGGYAGAAGTCSSGRTAKTTLRAWSGSSPVTAALMRRLPSGSGGSAIATCCLMPPAPRSSVGAASAQLGLHRRDIRHQPTLRATVGAQFQLSRPADSQVIAPHHRLHPNLVPSQGERRAVPHADERVLGQPIEAPVRALAHLCHEQLGLPESPRAGPQAAGLPALAQRPRLATPTCWPPSAASAPASAANASNAGAAPNPRLPNQSGERSWSTH